MIFQRLILSSSSTSPACGCPLVGCDSCSRKDQLSYCPLLVVTSPPLKFGLRHRYDTTEVFLHSVFSGCVLGSFWKVNFQFNEHFSSCGAGGDVRLSALAFPKLVIPLLPHPFWDVIYMGYKALPPVLSLSEWCAQRKILKKPKQWSGVFFFSFFFGLFG